MEQLHGAPRCPPWPPPACHLGHRGDLLETPFDATNPPFFSLSGSLSLSLPCTLLVTDLGHHGRRLAPSSRTPLLLRGSEKVRHTVLYFPAEGIEPSCPQSPLESPFPHRKPRSVAAKFTAAGPPLAKLTPQASPRRASDPEGSSPTPRYSP
jgi:hypothetical protein